MIGPYILGGLFITAGFSHFFLEKFFLRITPPWVPFRRFVALASGVVEIALGAGVIFNETRVYAAWGLIALLIAVWPANYYHYTSRNKLDPPKWALLLRLPLQIPLILWAYSYT
ncbi:DoxX family protein [Leptospira ilyithenensis]|uniref:DoxX-like family protein n=1 Tax=Leptospira ilyithenensis TaxID=2484901 RepID=A0A4R9LS36_9LEPT|nr:MauE/DoxX family redox-associated membrane protein [Leptospira ilyithenensis]TGN14074.1 DoxX-like family protein [Leptospira ilyithenensis]